MNNHKDKSANWRQNVGKKNGWSESNHPHQPI